MSKFHIHLNRPVISLEVVREEAPVEEINNHSPELNGLQEEDNTEEKIILTPQELEQEIQNAYQRGRSEGEIIGYQKCEHEIKPVEEKLQSAIQMLSNAKIEIQQSLEKFSLDLAFRIASKVIETEITCYPEIIKNKLQNIIHTMIEDSEITIFLHPEDYQFLQNYFEEIRQSSPQIRNLQVSPDTSIKKGGFLIETKGGILDARIDSILEEIKKSIVQKMKEVNES